MLPDAGVEESQYSHSSLPKHKPQSASASGGDSQQGALTKQDGDSMNHTLRAVLLQPRAQIILLQQAGTGEWLRRAGEISVSQTGISSHLTEVWCAVSGLTPSAAGMRNVYSTSSGQIQTEIHVLLNVSLL